MKKSTLFGNALVAIFFAAFVACDTPATTEETPAVEETVVEEPVVEEAVDTTAVEESAE